MASDLLAIELLSFDPERDLEEASCGSRSSESSGRPGDKAFTRFLTFFKKLPKPKSHKTLRNLEEGGGSVADLVQPFKARVANNGGLKYLKDEKFGKSLTH